MLLVGEVFVEATLVALYVQVLAYDFDEQGDDVALGLGVGVEAVLGLRAVGDAVGLCRKLKKLMKLEKLKTIAFLWKLKKLRKLSLVALAEKLKTIALWAFTFLLFYLFTFRIYLFTLLPFYL